MTLGGDSDAAAILAARAFQVRVAQTAKDAEVNTVDSSASSNRFRAGECGALFGRLV